MILVVEWITTLEPNNLLVSNGVNAGFTADAYISTVWRGD